MIQGLYAAAAGMVAIEDRQGILANNVANAATPGFKRQDVVQLGFYQTFQKSLRSGTVFEMQPAPGGGVKIVESTPDMAAGVLRNTDNPLNVAIQGPGYFVVSTARGERYTRGGDFTMDADGQLANGAGFKVMGDAGPVDVRGGKVTIAQDGRVTVDGIPAGTLRMVEFDKPARLMREGDSTYAASDEVFKTLAPATKSTLHQSQVEMSNVDVPKEMITMMLGMRAYEANQHVITTIDGTMSRLIDQVAMPS